MAFHSFEEISAWQGARNLAKEIRKICLAAQSKHDWAWKDQIMRSALSIMANIAEGNDSQTNAEFAMFLGYAKRSATEVRSHLYYGFDADYFDQKTFHQLTDDVKKIAAQLSNLIQYLRKTSITRRTKI